MADLGIARLNKDADANGTLTRADLADVVHRRLGLSRAESAGLVERVLHHMCHALSDGQNVKISGFGTFILRDKGQRVGRNPKTGHRGADRAAAGDDLPRQPDHARPDRQGLNRGWRPETKTRALSRRSANCRNELGVAQHILRYWETRFPQLRPMQRAGNRRYYRPADVDLARRIHRLLNQEGYTVRGVQKLLRDKAAQRGRSRRPCARPIAAAARPAIDDPTEPAPRSRRVPADRACATASPTRSTV